MQSQDNAGTLPPSTPSPSPSVSQSAPKQSHDGQEANGVASTDRPVTAVVQQDLSNLPQLKTGSKGRKQRSEEERKARRRESNRISAKRMRQRRAESTSNLRKEVADLKRMNAALELDNNSRLQEFSSMKEQNERIKEEIMLLEAELKEMPECPPEHPMLYSSPAKAPPAPFSVGMKRPLPDICSPPSSTSTKVMYDYPTTPEHISPAGPSSQPSPPLTPLKQSYAPFSSNTDINMRDNTLLSGRRSDSLLPTPTSVLHSGQMKQGKLQTAKIGLPGRSLVLSPRSPCSPPQGASSSAWHTRATPGHLNKAHSCHDLHQGLRSEGSIRADAAFGAPSTRYYMDDKFGDGMVGGSLSAAASMSGASMMERVNKVPRLEPMAHSSTAGRASGMRPSQNMDDLDAEESEREDGAFWGAVRRSNGYQRAAGWQEAAMGPYSRSDRMMVHRTAPVRNC